MTTDVWPEAVEDLEAEPAEEALTVDWVNDTLDYITVKMRMERQRRGLPPL